MKKKKQWGVIAVPVREQKRSSELLEDGWEPFAASEYYLWLRKKVDVRVKPKKKKNG